KTTAVAELRTRPAGGAEVTEVALRSAGKPWSDDSLAERLTHAPEGLVVAVDAPLTTPACGRCVRPVCPGMETCVDPAVAWLRTEGRALLHAVAEVPASLPTSARMRARTPLPQARIAPWAHRATDLVMTYRRQLLPMASLGHAVGTIGARASQLRRRLAGAGFTLHHNLIEVSPPATIAALCGEWVARGYKRDADPWRTRALILEQLDDLAFAPSSRMAREEVLQNDHGFDAVIAAYTAYRWAHEHWTVPDDVFVDDGWVFAPQTKA
ncbi:MAG: DUF429 domain-containing protein, partial [Proteobacteria bacterium]|nr:DUF429 domain-containing protein [Pseudomonadota bacterium]